MARSSTARLKDIAQAIDDVGKAAGGPDDVFKSKDRTGLLAVAAAFVIEAVKALPAEVIDQHPEVDWSASSSFGTCSSTSIFALTHGGSDERSTGSCRS